ncbi:MAG: hypothetical protein VKJ06_09120 [Vampirovibrionales bacterium]|nr:hypothetical protein [Vampirovibrionales bacterium]
MLSFDATFLIIMVSFVLFMMALKAMLFDPIQRIKQHRADTLLQAAEAEAAALARSETLAAECQAKLTQAHQRSQQLIAESRAKAQAEAQKRLDEARKQAQDALQVKMAELSNWQASTQQALKAEQSRLATHLIQQLHAQQTASVS